MKKRSLSARVVRATIAGIASVATLGGLASGCLDRPVSPASPNTTNVFVDQIRQSNVDKIDMLFMIDNSASMADKQKILQAAVPKLVERLVTPRCVDSATKAPTGQNFPNCAASAAPEFPPIEDIHLGVITSSLGAHGGDVCSDPAAKPQDDDKGRLIGSTRGVANHENLDFLWWNPKTDPVDQTDASTLIAEFGDQVAAAGEQGCGYEASLEAWYRFLVDPQPPHVVKREGNATIVEKCDQDGADCGADGGGVCVAGFCADKLVLAQRQAFLRSDSLVAVVMLSDENDCSIRDDGQGYLVSIGQSGNVLPRATSACNQNADDKCCTWCGNVPAEGCQPHAADPECIKGGYTPQEDPLNLRCWEQKRRFGIDLLYPLGRYVDGLSNPTIKDRSGNDVANPLFSTGGGVSRDKSLVFLAGIVGVPWQVVATDDSLPNNAPLKYKTARDIDWAKITRTGNQPPGEPHMVESNTFRPGLPDPTAPLSDPIHGHDWDISTFGGPTVGPNDLQFACIFPLATPEDCSGKSTCDCKANGIAAKSPLCWDGTQFGGVQHYAKAYPGLRQLGVLRDFGDNAIVASICPKEAINQNDPSYGYNPAVDAIVDRLKEQLSGSCLTRPVTVECEGTVDANGVCQGKTVTKCAIVEVEAVQGAACVCKPEHNRADPDPKLIKPVLDGLRKDRICGEVGQPACNQTDFCMCEIGEADPKTSCENDVNPQGVGWCYIDPSGQPAVGNPELVKDCNPQRQLRFVGGSAGVPTPKANSIVFIACLGKPLGE